MIQCGVCGHVYQADALAAHYVTEHPSVSYDPVAEARYFDGWDDTP